MPLFKRKKASPQPAETTEVSANTPAAAPQVTLASGRLAPVFLQMYRWIISANLAADVYQIESGEQSFGGQTLPLRGRFSEFAAQLREKVIEEQREDFAAAFQRSALAAVFSSGGTGVSGVYCLAENGETDFAWYELRAERLSGDAAQSLTCILYFRRLRDGNDFGNAPQRTPKPLEEGPELDWAQIRARRVSGEADVTFEYNVAQDSLIVHYGRQDTQPKQYDHYLARIEKQSDWRIHHDHIADVRRLLKDAIDGKAGEDVILYRSNANYGAPFRYHFIYCMPLEETGKATWVFGALRDVDESYRKDLEQNEINTQINGFVDKLLTRIYIIDTEKDLTWRVLRTEKGYVSEEKRHSFTGRIKDQIQRGVIAPESAEDYLEWTEKGFLARKTVRGKWEMDGRLKLPGSLEYRWYAETVAAVKDRPNTFLQIRRDITEAHNVRQQEFEQQEQLYLANYNQSMLDIMADLVEFRNVESGMHINHVRTLTRILLEDIAKRSPQYEIGPKKIDMYCRAATTHDIGKITIPDSILNKPGRLTLEEREVMQTHTTNGATILDHMEMPGEEKLKELCRDVALHHHERWDGKGYPEHLKGDEVDIGTQAIALADTYDALVSERCYKDAFSFEKAVEMILSGQCGAFNPRLLESLNACAERMKKEYEVDRREAENEKNEVVDNGQ